MKLRKIGQILIIVLSGSLLIASPVFAIVNPDNIAFGTGTTPLYRVFENVRETGDMLFVAEGYVDYTVTPTDYNASEAFLFQVMDVGGATTILSTTLNEYGDRPISIYQTAEQVTALGLASGSAYVLKITGNPVIFASEAGNTVTVGLTLDNYVDQLLGEDGGIAVSNPLRNFLIGMAENIEAEDTPTEYIVLVQGIRYLNITGGDIFLEGIPGLSAFCPILFQASIEPMEGDTPESTGTYALTLTPVQQWGQTTADGLTNLGLYLGINQQLAGSIVLMVIVMFFAVYVYKQTESGVTVLLLVAVTPFLGAWLGLMPMALAFIFVIFVSVLLGYFFFSRGAL